MAVLQIKRGTRAQLDAAAAASGLREGEPYLITDEGRLAVGLGVGTYRATARQGDGAPVVTESGTARTATSADAGCYLRFTNAAAKSYTFDSAQTYPADTEYHVRNVGAGDLTLVAAGTFVLNAPADGSLVIPQGGTATIKRVGAAEADVFGVTS